MRKFINFFEFIILGTGLMSRVFANGPGDQIQSQVESYQRLKNCTWCLTLSIIR